MTEPYLDANPPSTFLFKKLQPVDWRQAIFFCDRIAHGHVFGWQAVARDPRANGGQ